LGDSLWLRSGGEDFAELAVEVRRRKEDEEAGQLT